MTILLNTPVRSGSTWAFNVLQDIYDMAKIRYDAGLFFDTVKDDDIFYILKAHNIFSISDLKKIDNLKYITCLRNPREAVSSMNRVRNNTMEDINISDTLTSIADIMDNILEYMDSGGSVLIIRYEDLAINKREIYDQMNNYIGLNLDNNQIEEIWANNSREANIEKLRKSGMLDQSFKDIESKTLWHGSHISTEGYKLLNFANFKDALNRANLSYKKLIDRR
jgi:hypothetical protein